MRIVVSQVMFNLVAEIGDDGTGTGEHRFMEGEHLIYVGCRSYDGGILRYFKSVENLYVLREPTGHTTQWLFADPPAYTAELDDILNNISERLAQRRSRKHT